MSDKEIRIPGLTDAAFTNLTERLQRIKRGEPSQILDLSVQTPNTFRQLEFESEAELEAEEEEHTKSIVSSQPSDSEEDIPPMEQQTIRQLSNSVVPGAGGNAPSCITYPEPAATKEGEFELKSGLLHQIPKFHGLSNEDPNKHLKSFQFVCVSMCPRNADINILKLKAFPFSLEDRAKSWLIDLPAGHIDSWEKMMSEFLTKYFPASKITVMRKQITGIQQGPEETFCAYYERFKALVTACPSHGVQGEQPSAILL